jgi:hypothetical protein
MLHTMVQQEQQTFVLQEDIEHFLKEMRSLKRNELVGLSLAVLRAYRSQSS